MSDSLQKNSNNTFSNGRNRFQFVPEPSFMEENTEGNELNPKNIIFLLFRYKWLVIIFLTLGAAGAWFYADDLTPVYESNGTLMISSSGASSNDELSQIISQTTGYGTSSTLINELQILRSRKFSLQLARDLMKEDPGDINEYPVLWTAEEDGEVYRAGEETVANRIRNNLSFRQVEEESDVVEIIFNSHSPVEAAKIVNNAMETYVESSTRQNRQAAEATAEFLEKEKQEIRQKLEASEERLRNYMDSTGIVKVDEQASGMVSQRVDVETDLRSVNLELETINQAISNLEQQLERIKPGLTEQFSEAVGPRIRDAQEQLAAFERERTLIISKNSGVLDRKPVPPRLKYVDEQIARLKDEIKNLSAQLFTEDDEFMGMDSEDRAEMVANIQNRLIELQIERNQNRSRRDALRQHKEEMDIDFNELPEGMVELAKLQRDVRMNEELYLNVSRQYADMSVWKQSQFGFGRIIDQAVIPDSPVSPNKKLLLLLGLMLGGVVSAGFIALREFMDNSINNVDQLRSQYLPSFTLSVIPAFEEVSKKNGKSSSLDGGVVQDKIVLLQDRLSLTSEAFRRLKNHIIYQNGVFPPKTIAVTSPEKGDGKSTVVVNLGVAFAEEGYKTLIIDADFRRPKFQKYFESSDSAGLSEYLKGDIDLQQLIKHTDVHNLKVITAGQQIRRPETVVSNRMFKQLVAKLEEVFDVILFDTPPFGIISDSTSLLRSAESTLVVARYRKTNKGMLMRTLEELGRIQANVTDVVLNDFDPRKEAGSSYGAGYYQTLYSNYEAYVK